MSENDLPPRIFILRGGPDFAGVEQYEWKTTTNGGLSFPVVPVN